MMPTGKRSCCHHHFLSLWINDLLQLASRVNLKVCGRYQSEKSKSLWSSGSETFMSCGPLSKTLNASSPLLINKNTYLCFGYCNIMAELSHKSLCLWPPEKRSVNSKGGRVSRLRNPCLEGYNCIQLYISPFMYRCLLF